MFDMKTFHILISAVLILQVYAVFRPESFTNEPCGRDDFRCWNNARCIKMYLRCNGYYNCGTGDRSDEQNCSKALSDIPHTFEWVQARKKLITDWLVSLVYKNHVSNGKWPFSAAKVSVALYLTNETYFIPGNGDGERLSYQMIWQLYSKLFSTKLENISSPVLASFLNGFLVACLDARDIVGFDLVSELRSRVESTDGFVHPFILLSLCNANDTITTSDVDKLKNVFENPLREPWTDIQAYAIMALKCASMQPNASYNLNNISELTSNLKLRQYPNGTIDNLKTTKLVLQALLAAGDLQNTSTFNPNTAFNAVIDSRLNPDINGIYFDVSQAYYALPVFSYKSFINISSRHCKKNNKFENHPLFRDWNHQFGPKEHVRYSLWLGEDRTEVRTLTLAVPVNTTFDKIMEVAQQLDDRYRFKYIKKNNKPFVYSISRIEEDPEESIFWFLYSVREDHNETTLINTSPADYVPKDAERMVYWFKRGPWLTK